MGIEDVRMDDCQKNQNQINASISFLSELILHPESERTGLKVQLHPGHLFRVSNFPNVHVFEPTEETEEFKKGRTLSLVVTVTVWCWPVAACRRPSPVATEV